MPVLPAGPDDLPETALLRAATVLGVLGHAYVHMLSTPLRELPASIALPWAEVRRRLGRPPEPVLSYADLIVNNWRTLDPSAAPALRVANLDLLVPTVDNKEERVFYLTQLEILARCAPIVANVARAQDAARTRRWDEVHEALSIIEAVLVEVNTKALTLIDPRPASATFVDPVVWAKTVAPFAVPMNPGVLGPSGTASPIINLLDAFFGRSDHASQLGREILAHRRSYPRHWQRLIAAVGATSVRSFLTEHPQRGVLEQYEAAGAAYAGRDGFLGRHRRKVYGYLAVGFTVGRAVTIGGFSGNPQQRRWEDVDSALTASQQERRLPAAGRPVPVPHGHAAMAARSGRSVDRVGRRRVTNDGSFVTLVDLLRHNDARHGWWIAISGRVYDVTAFVDRHPGGAQILRAHAGLDATAAFDRAHRDPGGLSRLQGSLDIGPLERPGPTAAHTAWLDAAFALVELQNAFLLDRSFVAGTLLCSSDGMIASDFQVDRAANTLARFRDDYLPEFVAGPLQRVHGHPACRVHLDVGVTEPRCPPAGDRSTAVREQLDQVERWMATVKAALARVSGEWTHPGCLPHEYSQEWKSSSDHCSTIGRAWSSGCWAMTSGPARVVASSTQECPVSRKTTTTHTVDMAQIDDLNARLSTSGGAPVISAADIGLDGAAVMGSSSLHLAGSAVLVRLCWDGAPEFPDIHAHFSTGGDVARTTRVDLHSAALRELSHRLHAHHVWGQGSIPDSTSN
jgi:predicted heme/steroid binding protein